MPQAVRWLPSKGGSTARKFIMGPRASEQIEYGESFAQRFTGAGGDISPCRAPRGPILSAGGVLPSCDS